MGIFTTYFWVGIFIFLFAHSSAQAPSIQWQKCYGGSSYDFGNSIQQTAFDNGYVILGNTESNEGDISGNHGIDDYVVIKTNSAGILQWQKTYGGSNYEVGTCIKQTPDGGFILCGLGSSNDGDETGNHGDSDYWIVKINSTGIIQWQNSYGGSAEDNPQYISLTPDGGYIIGGYSSSTDFDVSGNHGLFDYWAVKINSVGSIQWQQSFGGSGFESGGPIKPTSDGGYIICGSSNSNNGDVSGNNGSNDYWIVKINSIGVIEWQKCLGGNGDDYAKDAIQTADGGYIVCGYSNSLNGDVTDNHGNDDYWIVKLNSNGTIQWKKSYGGSLFDHANSIFQTTDGGYLISGRSSSVDGDKTANNGAYDNWLVKINSAGGILWQKNFGGSADEDAKSVIPTNDGGIIVCGTTTSNNGEVSGNHGVSDLWAVKFSSILGLKDQSYGKQIGFFPNPCNNDLFVMPNYSGEKITISIMDINGNLVDTQTSFSESKQLKFKINVANGLYILKVKYQDDSEVFSKFVISK